MRVAIILLMLSASACTTTRSYENIVASIVGPKEYNDVTYGVEYWALFGSSEDSILGDIDKERSLVDLEECTDEYRDVEIVNEVFAAVSFIQCMYRKGWDLRTEEVIIISH